MIPQELMEPIVVHVKKTLRDQVIAALDKTLGNGHAEDGLTIYLPHARYSSETVTAATVLAYIKKNPLSSAFDLKRALGADPKAALAELREQKRVRTKGRRRGMRYTAAV